MPDQGGNRTYVLGILAPMLCQLSYAVRSVRVCDISEPSLVPSISMQFSNTIFSVLIVIYAGEYDVCYATMSVYPQEQLRNITYSNRSERVGQLAEHWASIPKVVGSIPTVARHIFQACPVWIYTQNNITNMIFT